MNGSFLCDVTSEFHVLVVLQHSIPATTFYTRNRGRLSIIMTSDDVWRKVNLEPILSFLFWSFWDWRGLLQWNYNLAVIICFGGHLLSLSLDFNFDILPRFRALILSLSCWTCILNFLHLKWLRSAGKVPQSTPFGSFAVTIFSGSWKFCVAPSLALLADFFVSQGHGWVGFLRDFR